MQNLAARASDRGSGRTAQFELYSGRPANLFNKVFLRDGGFLPICQHHVGTAAENRWSERRPAARDAGAKSCAEAGTLSSARTGEKVIGDLRCARTPRIPPLFGRRQAVALWRASREGFDMIARSTRPPAPHLAPFILPSQSGVSPSLSGAVLSLRRSHREHHNTRPRPPRSDRCG